MAGMLRILLLLPVLIPQVIWVRLRAARLQEAGGTRTGESGAGPTLRLLIVGDSSAAGVGVAHQDDALLGRMVRRLSERYHLHWSLQARCGATTTTVLAELDALPSAKFDVAVLALGVNDAKNGMARARWRGNYTALIDLLQAKFGVTRILVTGVPPLGEFPLLPTPLRTILGRRASLFDEDLQALCASLRDVDHVPLDFPMDTTLMATDGFHPGPVIYDRWAERMVDEIG